MAQPKEKSIKNIYHDALYWAISPKSKGQAYHLTRTQESVLRKLIHYDSTNPVIPYSNETIGKHIYLEEASIEKIIPTLRKKGYIKTINYNVNSKSGGVIERRKINIEWAFIAEILATIPSIENNKEETLSIDEVIELDDLPEEKAIENTPTINHLEEVIETNRTKATPTDTIPSKWFNEEQTNRLLNFKPIGESPLETLRLEYGKNYLIKNAEKISTGIKFNWDFNTLVYTLTEGDIEGFETLLEKVVGINFGKYQALSKKYVGKHK